ncbi:hypothetical protein MtrunA17_Chr6g0453541 [Medicago truncatula]|uniref:Uncharacterized protein n=1 Tax=Medicago truncatula TaxID=3880 RepID=A0A396H9Y1_MEDTR|nr:hypothetical protein MtrunA17_Chr6g0453541 [Medicago truncatula]
MVTLVVMLLPPLIIIGAIISSLRATTNVTIVCIAFKNYALGSSV